MKRSPHLFGLDPGPQGRLTHSHEIAFDHGRPVVLLIGVGHRQPLLDVETIRELGEDVFLVATHVGRCHRLPELTRGNLRGVDRQVRPEVADEIPESRSGSPGGAGEEARSERRMGLYGEWCNSRTESDS